MTVKSTVSFTDRHHEFARKKTQEGAYASVSSLVAAGIERLMQDEAERETALEAMKETIARRLETPRNEWGEINEGDDLFAQAQAKLDRRQR